MIVLNYIVGIATFYSKPLARLIEGRAVVLVRDGRIDDRARRHAMLTREELMAALRTDECKSLDDVHYAFLENTGEITVVHRKRRNGGAG